MFPETLTYYLSQFKKLRLDRSHGGPAPHKPILLISLLQAYRSGLIRSREVYMTPELVALFKENWSLLVTATNFDCKISYPFYHLKSDKFWKLHPREGFDNLDTMGSMVKSLTNLNAAVAFAELDEALFLLAIDSAPNQILTESLLETYFPSTLHRYTDKVLEAKKVIHDLEGKILRESPDIYQKETRQLFIEKNEEEIFLRGSLFKREIPKIYNNTCCISGMQITTLGNISMIDACHIKPFSHSFDDTVSNGIALCPNLHRAFDRGLISLDDNYRVLISPTFQEKESDYQIGIFAGKQIQLPRNDEYLPDLENVKWHRHSVFIDS